MNVEDGLLVVKCVVCNTNYKKNVWRGFGKKDLRARTDSMQLTLAIFFWCYKKMFIYMSTRIACRDSKKRHCQRIRSSAAIWPWKKLQMLTTKSQKGFSEDFEIRHLVKNHDLCVQSDTLLVEIKSKSFCNNYVEIYKFVPTHFLLVPGLA